MEFLLAMLSTTQEKSKQGAESIGRAFKSIFLNMQKIQEGKDVKGINKLEDLLNKHGIALRKSEHEWRRSEEVIKDVMKQWNKWDRQINCPLYEKS